MKVNGGAGLPGGSPQGASPIRVAVIGPLDLVGEIAEAGKAMPALEVLAYPYERADEAPELCGEAAHRSDAILFTGAIGYRHGMRAGRPGVPVAYVPYSPMWLYAPLFGVTDRDSLRRVSLDTFHREVLEATYSELGLILERVEAFPRTSEDPADPEPSPDELVAFHVNHIRRGHVTYALTCVLSVYRRLRKAGVPCLWLVPSRVALQEALEKLRYVAEGARARGTQIVVGLARLRPSGANGGSSEDGNGNGSAESASSIRLQRMRLKAYELLLSQVEEFDGQLVDSGGGDFLFFATRARFEKATGYYAHFPLVERLQQVGLAMNFGVGLGATAGEAGDNAAAALDEAVRRGVNNCFVMTEDRRLIGPLGRDSLAYGVRNTDPAFLEMAEEMGTAVASLQRVMAALEQLPREFTARDLSQRLHIGLRTAHRTLKKLLDGGWVIEVGQESAGTRGRPRRVFRRAEPRAAEP